MGQTAVWRRPSDSPPACSTVWAEHFYYVRHVPNDPLSIVLADCQHFFREGLRGMLDTAGMAVVGEAKTGAEATTLARDLTPDVVVLDPRMPDGPASTTLRLVAAASPASRVVVLTVSNDDADVLDAFRSGACGYLLKNAHVDELVAGIRQVGSGQAVLSREAMRALVSATGSGSRYSATQSISPESELTARELDVLRLIVDGTDNAAIGLELSISRHTVKQHVTNIFEKLGVHTRVEAAVYAVRTGLV